MGMKILEEETKINKKENSEWAKGEKKISLI